MSSVQNPKKVALRMKIKNILEHQSASSRIEQSSSITAKIINSEAFKNAESLSIYLSTDGEVNTMPILMESFKENKKVYVPSYSGKKMIMLRLKDLADYESLPLTSWKIKQPKSNEGRENILDTDGLDLIIMPGVAFSKAGERCGHGRGYYDKFLFNYFEVFPKRVSTIDKLGNIKEKINEKKTILFALAFNEQIVDIGDVPIDTGDVLVDSVITSD